MAAADRSSNRLLAREKGKAGLELELELLLEEEDGLEFDEEEEVFLPCKSEEAEGLGGGALPELEDDTVFFGSPKVSINRLSLCLEDNLVLLLVLASLLPTKAGSTSCFQCSKVDSLMAALRTGLVLHK